MQHRFVEYIPDRLDNGILYVSMEYRAVSHLCCCGCGSEVVTPLGPTAWHLIYDGKAVTLEPSIGSWRLPCRSHYWIRGGRVVWAPDWSDEEISEGREMAAQARRDYYHNQHGALKDPAHVALVPERANEADDLWARIRAIFRWRN